MHDSRGQGNRATRAGAILFLLLLVALGLWLYGQSLRKTSPAALMIWATAATTSAVLIVCMTITAFVLSIGRFLRSAEAERDKHDRHRGLRRHGAEAPQEDVRAATADGHS